MEGFIEYLQEDLKKVGLLKMPKDLSKDTRFRERGANRKSMRALPDKHNAKKKEYHIPTGLTRMIRSLDTSQRAVDVAKQAPSGVWRVSKKEVLDIALKYKFIVPNDDKPMKHLGSTGIQLIRYKPGMFYLYKPHKKRTLHRKKRSPFGPSHSKIIKGIIGT
jgi:hypothetical protein